MHEAAIRQYAKQLRLPKPLEVHWVRLPATEKIAFDHKFEPAKQVPPESR
jgi:hypothetical protein